MRIVELLEVMIVVGNQSSDDVTGSPGVVLLEMSAPLGGAADIVALVVVMAPVWESVQWVT